MNRGAVHQRYCLICLDPLEISVQVEISYGSPLAKPTGTKTKGQTIHIPVFALLEIMISLECR